MPSIALIGCAVAILFWGAAGIFDKLAMKGIDPVSGVLVRMAFITTAVLVFCVATGRWREVLSFPASTYLYLLVGGLLGGFVGQVAYFVAVKHAPVSQVVPITATYPVIAFLLAVLFLREHVTLAKVGGLVLVIAGLMLVSGGNGGTGTTEGQAAVMRDRPEDARQQHVAELAGEGKGDISVAEDAGVRR